MGQEAALRVNHYEYERCIINDAADIVTGRFEDAVRSSELLRAKVEKLQH